MFIARLNEDSTITLGHYKSMFPTTSFTSMGPNDEFYEQNDCYKVSMIKPYDPNTEMLQVCAPYLEEGIVYTVQVVPIA